MSDTLWLIGHDLAAEFSKFHTEIRETDPFLMKKMLYATSFFREIRVIGHQNIGEISASRIVTATESVSRKVVAKYFPDAEVIFDTTFLRYDEDNVKSIQPVNFDRKSDDPFDLQMMALAYNEAEESSDWFRHVGTVLVKEGRVVAVNHNQPVPSEHMPYVFGNPRDFIEAGMLSHFSDALHSEDGVFAEALRRGISTAGAHAYVSVFPCPRCSKLIAYSGITKCFFGSGHASLDGERDLKSKGVELVYVPIRPRT